MEVASGLFTPFDKNRRCCSYEEYLPTVAVAPEAEGGGNRSREVGFDGFPYSFEEIPTLRPLSAYLSWPNVPS